MTRCRYFIWWWVTICAVAFTVWYEPYVMAFAQYPGLEPPWGLQAWAEYLMIAIFATDMLVTFHVAYYDNEVGRVQAGRCGCRACGCGCMALLSACKCGRR